MTIGRRISDVSSLNKTEAPQEKTLPPQSSIDEDEFESNSSPNLTSSFSSATSSHVHEQLLRVLQEEDPEQSEAYVHGLTAEQIYPALSKALNSSNPIITFRLMVDMTPQQKSSVLILAAEHHETGMIKEMLSQMETEEINDVLTFAENAQQNNAISFLLDSMSDKQRALFKSHMSLGEAISTNNVPVLKNKIGKMNAEQHREELRSAIAINKSYIARTILRHMSEEQIQTALKGMSEAEQNQIKQWAVKAARPKTPIELDTRDPLVTPVQIRRAGAAAFQKAGFDEEQIKQASRAIAYERAAASSDEREYRIDQGTLYRDPDSLPIEKRASPNFAYRTKELPKPIWAVTPESRYTVIDGKELGIGSFKTVHGAVDIHASAPDKIETRAKASITSYRTDDVLEGLKSVLQTFSADEIEQLGLAGVLQDLHRRGPDGRLEATDELYEGDLYSRVARQLNHEQKLNALKKIGATLRAFHAKGLVHRDIKPENTLVDDKNEAHVSDSDLAAPHLEKTKAGTPDYQDALSKKYLSTPFQDIYALAQTAKRLFGKNIPPELKSAIDEIEKANSQIQNIDIPDSNLEEFFNGLQQQYPAYENFMKLIESLPA